MTVAELIKELEQMPQDKEVWDCDNQLVEGCFYCRKRDKVIMA